MNEQLTRIKQLVGQGRIETAIDELKGLLSTQDLLNDALLQSGKLSTLQKNLREGNIDWSDANITHHSIMESILGLVKIIEEEEPKLPKEAQDKTNATDKTENSIQVTGDKNTIFGSVKGGVNYKQ